MAIPGRPRRPRPSFVDRTIKAATLRIDSQIGDFDLVSITDYQKADKFYIEGGDASPDRGRGLLPGQRSRADFRGAPPVRAFGGNQFVGGLYGMKVEGDYTGQFADPFYGYLYGLRS